MSDINNIDENKAVEKQITAAEIQDTKTKDSEQDKIVMLLPSYNPDEKLVSCVKQPN